MTKDSAPAAGSPSVVVEPAWLRFGAPVALPVLGAVAGWLLALAAGVVAGLPWFPFQGPFELVASWPQPQGTIGLAAFGALAGLGFTSFLINDRLTVTVAGDRVELRRGRRAPIEVEGARIAAAFADRDALVLQDADGDELARERTDITTIALRTAFREHGHRWLDADPHGREFELWVEGTPGVSARADALLRTRAHALKKRNDGEAAQLREALRGAGYLVRDQKRAQHVRPRPHRTRE
ncbi:hypothetical protein ACL03H_23440 [Saccharopolyspora sp. MS10]|uniref:YqeB family protein n=1 Tax=Saccharopolyspora sp. MS10 TaxID=3385973 RepID=UPI0039A070DA